jgi:hypothetical protein
VRWLVALNNNLVANTTTVIPHQPKQIGAGYKAAALIAFRDRAPSSLSSLIEVASI